MVLLVMLNLLKNAMDALKGRLPTTGTRDLD